MYAEYSYYSGTYGGSTVPSDRWNYCAAAASDWMNAATFGRLENGVPTAFDSQVKRCCCELSEQIYLYVDLPQNSVNNSQLSGIPASETSGEYSVTYRTASDSASALLYGSNAGLQDLLLAIARKHLGRTGLLYRGVDG